MIKKIPVAQLRVGMYVSDMNAGWMNHPFLRNSMKIDSEAQLAKIFAAGIKEVFIDTERGPDVGDAPTAEEAAREVEADLERLAEAPESRPVIPRASLAEELSRARSSFGEATRLIRNIMDDVRLGRQVELDAVKPVVEKITNSVIRNSNAMMTMRRLQQRDDYTFLHSVSVCAMLATLAKAMDMDMATIHQVALGGMLHDIGYVRVNQEVLNKPGKLSNEEYRHVKSHVVLGADLLRQLPGIPKIAHEILEHHHERYDGSGYPRGLKGEEISTMGRMAAIVDVYDAITSDRVYHPGMNPGAAMRKLFDWSKSHFDPALFQVFVKSIGIYPVGALVLLESGRLGVVVEQREKSLLQPMVRVIFDTRRGHYLPPQDVDLSRPLGGGGGDRIVSHESPKKWGIDLPRFLA
ncbi:MAG TPA: HD-GYP domain-containing protein [Azospira sp.]|nr:HD-GYP domain-containing protein [Azospira sp.]